MAMDAAKVLALKAGDKVWIVGGYARSVPENIGTVVRITNTQVIALVDHSFHGGSTHERKFTRLPGKYGFSAGYEVGHRSFADSLHSLATAAEVKAHEEKLATKARERKAHAKAEQDREETRELLNKLLPQSCYAQVESTGLINVQITNLKSVEQVTKLAVLLERFLTDRPKARKS